MSSEYQVETRRRSRSKTPFLRSSCDHETCELAGEEGHVHHHHQQHKKKAPNVQTIIEETVEVTSSSSSPKKQTTTQTQSTTQKTKTSDYSSEDNSPDNKLKKSAGLSATAESQQRHMSSSSSRTVITTKSSSSKLFKGSENVGAAATSTPKAIQNFLQRSFASHFSSAGSERQKETKQNQLNTEFERSQRASGGGQSSQQSSVNKSYSQILGNSNSDASDHIAYLEYKRAGEYWKTTPKTDYTYSELSPHRRELAPGVVAMPNMSRRSLENHHERINFMIERDPAQEEFIRRRYESSRYAQNRYASEKLTYDSGDEIDYQYDNYRKNQYNAYRQENKESWYLRIITAIVTTVTSAWSTLTGGGGAYNAYDGAALYQTKYGNVERGFFGTIAHGIASFFAGIVRYIYLFISSILYADTWLLQSSNAENKGKKRFLLFLLMLLPLLLLGAWWLLEEDERGYYLQRTQALVPLSLLASWQSALYATGNSLHGYFLQLPVMVKSTWEQHYSGSGGGSGGSGADTHLHIHNIEQKLQKSLTAEEYENILNHVNSYVQQLIDLKFTQQQREQAASSQHLTAAQTQLIVQIIRENLERLAREKRTTEHVQLGALSEADVLRLAELVRVQLEASGWTARAVPLPAENLAEIKRLIAAQLEVHNHAHYTLLVERLDLDALLARILSAPQLAKFIDARIELMLAGKRLMVEHEGSGDGGATTATYTQQQRLISEMNNEIAFIKLALSDKLSENEDLHQSIGKLRVSQDDLLKRMQEHELSTDSRFSALLAEIEGKLFALKDDQFKMLNQQIKLSLVEILGFKQTATGGKLEDIDLQNWVRSMFVAKDYLEQRLLELNKGTDSKIRDEIDRSSMLLMRDISERLKHEILLAVEVKHNESATLLKGKITAALSEEEVRKIVKSVLAIYDADKTGLVDFALESAGGQILSTRCTESFQTKTAQISMFGIPLWYPTNTPRVAISPNVQPGECWAFQSFPGFLVLKLNSLVYVTGFTLEHIPKSLSPNGRIDSAPRNFTVWGLEHEKDYEPVLFGEYEYVDNDASLQYFPVQNKDIKRPYEIVELRIESNHGNAQYTCLYRFRVHGKPPAV